MAKKIIDDKAAAKLGAGIVDRAKARDAEVKKLIGTLEKALRRNLSKVLDQIRAGNMDAANVASSLGGLYESLKAMGLDAELQKITNVYGDELAAVQKELKQVDPKLVLTDTDVTAAEVLIDYDFKKIGTIIERYVGDVRGTVMRAVVSGSVPDYSALAENAGLRVAAQVETELNTGLSAFNQSVTNMKADEAGLTTFVYLGPEDHITRPFCQDLIDQGRVFTREEIEAMDNEQGLPVMETGGGWNCRHQWRPLNNDEESDLATEEE